MKLQVFRLKDAIENLLAERAEGRYEVITPKRKASAENITKLPQVRVFYSEGTFDKSKSSINSPYHHDASFKIYIQTAAKSAVNLAILENPAATEKQLAEALAAASDATVDVDEKMDTLLSVLFDIIMTPMHRDLGMGPGEISNRWIGSIKKQNPAPDGAVVTNVAAIALMAQCMEAVSGEIGKPAAPKEGVDTIIDLGDESKQGVKT
jgi:hypothetical protein